MRVGGNAACADYFKKHGGSSLLSTKDAKIKYSSKQATQYKAEIKKRAELDGTETHPTVPLFTLKLMKTTPIRSWIRLIPLDA